jgi:hypothetical protein
MVSESSADPDSFTLDVRTEVRVHPWCPQMCQVSGSGMKLSLLQKMKQFPASSDT